MRPINKGLAPKNYASYNQAKDDLRSSIGSFCSYCEINISNQPDIEHVSPKSKNHDTENDWGNFLLACKTCNTIKSNNNDNRDGYIFPDTHNTAYAYRYTQTKIEANHELSEEEKDLAAATIELVKLNRQHDTNGREDDRIFSRVREWDKAVESLDDYKNCSNDEMARQIGRSPSGFHSSWLEVFSNYSKVKQEILKNVNGTAMECYCDDLYPCNRLERE